MGEEMPELNSRQVPIVEDLNRVTTNDWHTLPASKHALKFAFTGLFIDYPGTNVHDLSLTIPHLTNSHKECPIINYLLDASKQGADLQL